MKWILLGGLMLTTVATLAQDEPFPWDRVVGIETIELDDETRARVEELAYEIPNYHGCRASAAQCVIQDPPDPTAQRLVGYIARRVLAGDSFEQIEEGVANRRRSAHPRRIVEINIGDAPCRGAEDPLVTIVEFAEFECPFCRVASPILERLVAERPDEIRLCYKNFPVRSHDRATAACIAGLAAHQQGRFWEMHDALYESAPDLEDDDLLSCAEQAGLDLEQFRRDIESEQLLEEVMADKYEGLELGVDRTPTIFINGKEYVSELTEEELADRIDEESDLVRQ